MGEHKPGMKALAEQSQLYPQEALLKTKPRNKSLFIGIPKESSMQENRLALTPQAVNLLVNRGHEVVFETGAGIYSKYSDSDYNEAGARIVYSPEEVFKADTILKVEPPTDEEIELLKPGQTLFSALLLGNQNADFFKKLQKKRVTAIGFELIEDKVGGKPVMRAMSEIAGTAALMIASEYLTSTNNGKGIILGGITGVPPTKVVILGAGTVAEYAARTAQGMGADIKVFDNNIYKLRRLREALNFQVYTSTIDSLTLANALQGADVAIGALKAEKGRTPCVVTEEMVANMKPESVIVDISIDHGGCFETSEITSHKRPVFKKYEVIHYCVPNIASRVARTGTISLSNIFTPILNKMADLGGVDNMIFENEWFRSGVYCFKGTLTNEHIAKKFDLTHRDLSLLIAARL